VNFFEKLTPFRIVCYHSLNVPPVSYK